MIDIRLITLEPYRMACMDRITYTMNSVSIAEALINIHPAFGTLQALASKLYQLQIVVHAGDSSSLARFGEIVASARSLRKLSVYLTGRLGNSEVNSEMVFERTSLFPYLTRALNRFGLSSLPSLSTLELLNLCICREAKLCCSNTIHWPGLRNVTFTCLSFIEQFSSELAHIRHLSLHLDPPYESTDTCCPRPTIASKSSVKAHLHKFQDLESFEIRNGAELIDQEIFQYIGKTLRSLFVHSDQNPDSSAPSSPKQYLSANVLAEISSACRRIRELEVDAPNDERMVGPHLTSIATAIVKS
jgi:hypothetical protein